MLNFKLKDYQIKDTIAAIATFPSRSALGVIKISGKKSIPAVSKIFKPAKTKDLRKVKSFTLHYGWIIDEVLVSVMRGPKSYTREDVVEISCHGGAVILNKILELLIAQGLRMALPGEFTYRALVNGRIDLLQAESILGVVDAKTDGALELASAQLKGTVSKEIDVLKEQVKDLSVLAESSLNFPEDDEYSLKELKAGIKKLSRQMDNLSLRAKEAKVMREGLKCVIVGKANAGKSTLFNRLLREERVIVSRVAGTTRDVIEETISIKGLPLRIYDTAGILEPKDLVSKAALAKTKQIFKEADLVILILDGSKPLNKDDAFLLEKIEKRDSIIVINKADLPRKLKHKADLTMSALKSKDLEKLEQAIYTKVHKTGANRQNIIFLSQYQARVLEQVKKETTRMNSFIKQGQPVDFIATSLKYCLENLGKLTGEVLSEEILESIFSKFCIGK